MKESIYLYEGVSIDSSRGDRKVVDIMEKLL